MFCNACGARIPDGSQFCPECGAPVKLTTVMPGSAPAPCPPAKRKPSPAVIACIAAAAASVIAVGSVAWARVIGPQLANRQSAPVAAATGSVETDAATTTVAGTANANAASPAADATTSSPESAAASPTPETPASSTYDAQYFTFSMPSSWQGVLEPATQSHTSGMYHADFYLYGDPDRMVWRVDGATAPASPQIQPGSPNGTAAGTEIWNVAHGGSSDLTTAQQETWLLVLTGGTVTRDQVTSAVSAEAAGQLVQSAADIYFNLAIIPTVQIK